MSGRDDLLRQAERWRNAPRLRPAEIEKPGPGQESVWDYPRPPRVEPCARRVRVVFADTLLADSRRALRALETSSPPVYYVPPEDARSDLLTPDTATTLCEWKGAARYWSVRVGAREAAAVAWSYPDPFEGFEALRNHLAFFPGRVDACLLDDERARPQSGDYYGGWITDDVVGPFKGEPGSERW